MISAPTARSLAELAQRLALPAGAARQLVTLTELLVRHPDAPTAVREVDQVVDHHIADSLVALELDGVRHAQQLLDIGSGAGLPGLPLAIALPNTSVTLLESNARKCRFIDTGITACGLVNTEAVGARAEAWPDGLGRFDLVTARALGPLDVVAEYAAPLLRLGGRLVVWRGRRDSVAEVHAARAAEILGLSLASPVQVHPFPAAENRYLHVILKVRETPDRFPRRVGMAVKRPLGSDRPRR